MSGTVSVLVIEFKLTFRWSRTFIHLVQGFRSTFVILRFNISICRSMAADPLNIFFIFALEWNNFGKTLLVLITSRWYQFRKKGLRKKSIVNRYWLGRTGRRAQVFPRSPVKRLYYGGLLKINGVHLLLACCYERRGGGLKKRKP